MLNEAFMKKSFYILGAGASAGIIPMTHQQGELILERHLRYGSYSASEIELDQQAKRILGSNQWLNHGIRGELCRRLQPGAVRALSMQLMTPSHNYPVAPDQYLVFGYAAPRSVLFNFNVDGLANIWRKHHHVFHPHGMLDPAILQSPEWDKSIDICLFYSIEPPTIPGVLLPQKEPFEVIQKKEYSNAGRLLLHTSYVVLIGYSFGFDGSNLDDWATFHYFKELFKEHNKTIIVIDPFRSRDIVDMLRYHLESDQVIPVPAYWEHLSKAKLALERIKKIQPHEKNMSLYNLDYLYQRILDSDA